MKITIELDPSDPRFAEILRKLADLVDTQRDSIAMPQRRKEEVPPLRPWRLQPKPDRVVPLTPDGVLPWVQPFWYVDVDNPPFKYHV